jgi:hypothetical protein
MKKLLIIGALCVALTIPGMAAAQSEADALADSFSQINQYNEAADLNDGRGFAIPGEIIFPGTPGYYGEATPGHRFIPLKKLLMFTTVWNVDAARNMLKGGTGKKDVQIRDLLANEGDDTASLVYCSIERPSALGASTVAQASIGTIAATNRKAISADVLATAIVEAADRNANFIMFMAEGVNREVDATGWGIGFNTTQAQIYSGGNDKSNISSGGFGYSRGWAGYIDYPWLQFTYLRVTGIESLVVVAPAPEVVEVPVAAVVVEEEIPAAKIVKVEDVQTGNHKSTSTVQ